ncbi:histidine kinase [Asanoa siamensis]|uniref:histidine kinase n=2 Tax=Asanoa siamensis TaxID=926357 RepID=A0ABQ4CHB1_9ACTN|nr:histidine kinase [Asanoa siamensis]
MPSVEGMTTAVVPSPAVAAPRGIVRQLLTDSAYVIVGFPLAIAGFVASLVGVVLSAGLIVTGIGLPVMAGALLLARFFADLERLAIGPVLRIPRVRPEYRAAPPDAGLFRRVLAIVGDSQSWLDVVHALVKFVLSIFSFVVTITWWAGALGGLTYWTYDWAIPRSPDEVDLNTLLGLGSGTGPRLLLYTAIGLFFLLSLPIVVRGVALLQASFSKGMLTGVAEMRNRITTLEGQRRAAVSAEATALRKLERDIHDGPQQRLVRLAMDLGRAQQQFDHDPEAARRTIEEALTQTRETLDELRSLSRGIAPPILVDRGLPSALAALASRGVIPIELSVDPALGTGGGRLDPAVESAAYFVVAESLTNVAKHSRAQICRVVVSREGKDVRVEISDDGEGGAHVSKGHGLAGLADRVHAAGGRLTVTSPAGGPTLIQASLPV